MEHKPFYGLGARSLLLGSIPIAVLCVVLYIISDYNYLLFHTIVEFFSITVALGIFVTGWNARDKLKSSFLPFLGIVYLFIAFLDFLHTLAYAGMGVFKGYNANLPTQLWIAARFMESLSLLAATFLLKRKIRYGPIFLLYLVLSLFLISTIFYLKVFPSCYIEGIGLTPFKKVSEYIISSILLITVFLVNGRRERFEEGIFVFFIMSIILTVFSELAFTFYISVYGFSNMVGHILKVASFYLIYRAVIQKSITEPYDLIFKDLKESQESLMKLNEYLETRVMERTADLSRANAALRNSEARYMDLYENAPDIFISVDAKTAKIIECNETTVRMTGYKKEELVGRPIYEVYHPSCIKHVKKTVFPRFKKTGLIHNEELQIRRKDGTKFDVILNTTAVRDDVGNVLYSRSIMRDITKRKRAEEAMRESEEIFRNLFQTSRDFICITDQEGLIIDANNAALELFGYSFKELSSMKAQDLFVNPEDRQILMDLVFKYGYIINREIELRKKDGEIIDAIMTVNVRRDKNNNTIGFFSIGKDVTEKKRLELQLLQAEKLSAVGTMISGVAHEINNPLTSIIGYSQLLSKQEVPKDIKNKLNVILKESIRSSKIIGSLLTFARKHKPQRNKININDILIESIELREYELSVSNIDVQTSFSDDLPWTFADPYQIQQVFVNLINNALDAIVANQESGVLTIKTERKDDAVMIEFKDTGPGIPNDVIKKVFEPFFTTKEMGKGTGLGLSMAYGIIKEHGGTISVESKPGEWAKFIVTLPIIEDTEQMEERVKTYTKQFSGEKTVLVVEDEASLRNFLFEALTEGGFTVEGVSTGEKAISLLGTKKYDAVVSDIKMPGIGGKELYMYVRKRHPEVTSKIIFITGDVLSKDTQEFLNTTKSRFIEKPFDVDDLVSMINDILSE